MAFVEIDWKPPEKQLRQFGYLCLVFLPLIGWVFSGRPGPSTWTPTTTKAVAIMAGIGAVIAGIGAVKAALLRPVFVGACLLAFPIGLVVGEVLFFVIFALVFTPMSLIFRLIGRDSLDRHLEPNAKSYYRPKAQPKDVRQYFRQY